MTEQGYMSVAEVAAYLGVSRDWVYEKAASGELPSYKFGGHRRFLRAEVDAYVEAHRERPAGEVSSLESKRG